MAAQLLDFLRSFPCYFHNLQSVPPISMDSINLALTYYKGLSALTEWRRYHDQKLHVYTESTSGFSAHLRYTSGIMVHGVCWESTLGFLVHRALKAI